MKINQIYEFYQASEKIFRCPVCHTNVSAEKPASIVCRRGHCYTMAKDGYLNLLPNQKVTRYQKELFESRRRVFAKNYYQPLAEELCQMIAAQSKESLCMIDAGCGEGYYDCFLQEYFEHAQIYAFDSMKEAIRMGAKTNKNVRWFVGNLADIPIQNGQADVVLEIFAPANYSEFNRVLKPGGVVIKIIPGQQYLKELRTCITGAKPINSYTSERVETYFASHMKTVELKHLCYEREVDAEAAEYFLRMTPMMFGRSIGDTNISRLTRLTFDFVLLLGHN